MGTWDEMAAGWDNDPAVLAYANAAWTSLEECVEVSPQARVLDFGCGTGLLTERLAPRVQEVVAVDASSEMIEVLQAKELPNVSAFVAQWTPGVALDDSITRAPFELIVCSSVCAFLDDYPGAVTMLAGLLAPGGCFVQWDWELDPADEEPYGLTSAAITEALEGAGLEVVSVGIGFDIPFEEHRMRPLMGIGRAVR